MEVGIMFYKRYALTAVLTTFAVVGILITSGWAVNKERAEIAMDPQNLTGRMWIWYPGEEAVTRAPAGRRYFRKAFEVPPDREVARAFIVLTADNKSRVFFNGLHMDSTENWRELHFIDIKPRLQPGRNVIAIEAFNEGLAPNPAGLVGKLVVMWEENFPASVLIVPIDDTWKASRQIIPGWQEADFDDTAWVFAEAIAIMGFGPWGTLGTSQRITLPVPDEFPRFYFRGHEEKAQLLNHFLWHHFHTRLHHCKVLFNKEYLLKGDMWLGGGYSPMAPPDKPIQELHREFLLEMQLGDEGYVFVHQHFSHAHDHGWPFPLWTQSSYNPLGVKGVTAGWHFQEPEYVGDFMKAWGEYARPWVGETAAGLWELNDVESRGIIDNRWHLKATGPNPAILTPPGVKICALNAPYLQLRWNRTGEPKNHIRPYIEWLGEGDTHFSPERRVYFRLEKTPHSEITGFHHSHIRMHTHPEWTGTIERIRINLAPGESHIQLEIDSFFTVYNTIHTNTNPIFILASYRYFTWTGDLDFLHQQINRMRLALKHHQTVMNGLKLNRIRNTRPGKDGLPGWHRDEEGVLTINPGHGLGSNYWDLLPFGWDDFYATSQYYAATIAMADIEEAIANNPGWGIPQGALKMDPEWLREHARAVKEEANRIFWNEETGRFLASIDQEGTPWDFGFTFVNLNAIWYDMATPEHAREIMDWLTGQRIVEGDTSVGEDIYYWRFGPRATTRRNVEWYGQGWSAPHHIPWGGQVQDGGAVLGFTFYDLWARLKVLGPGNAWQRLKEILEWEREVRAAGGYRRYYAQRGVTMQGGGTAGGIGIDYEFFESILLPSIVTYGFVGLNPRADLTLAIHPRLPQDSPQMGVNNLLYRHVRMDIQVSEGVIELYLHDKPVTPLQIALEGKWLKVDTQKVGSYFLLAAPGAYRWERQR